MPTLSDMACNVLSVSVLKDEVRRAVMGMNSWKAPSLDGFQPFFFKHYWHLVGSDI